MALTEEREREREETCTPKSYKAKLKRLRSATLTCRDQTVTFLDMQRLSNGKGFISLRLSINTFKQVFIHV
jgi:hypothetical protein